MKLCLRLGAGLGALLPSCALAAASGPTTVLEPYVVTAARAPQTTEQLPVAVDVFGGDELQASPASTVDEALRASAAFSLFRRSGSLIANPTAQGVSLRNIGPSGASRSLVLLDGVPLNDPFGGWVAWSSVPVGSLDRVEILRGGGSGAWGNAALSGTVQLFSAAPDQNAGQATATFGDFGWKSGEAGVSQRLGASTLGLSLRSFSFGGFQVVGPAQRGPVDQRLSSRHQSGRLSWRTNLGGQTALQLSGRYFHEKRGNGTPLQNNESEAGQVAASLSGTGSAQLTWNATAYYQEQSFASFFSSVNATRTVDTPANYQFDVPATAGGASVAVAWQKARSTTSAGVDLRRVKGETRERFLFASGQFTRVRRAGGEQTFAGIFLNHDRALAETWRGSIGARLDSWDNAEGHRRETDSATGAIVRDDRYAAQRGFEFSPQLGLVWTPATGLKLRSSAYRAFRVPTLNEYFRPFRVGALTTEANPALQRESLTGGELGIDFNRGHFRVSGTAFVNDLWNAVANVTQTPTARTRMNLDRARIEGLELTGDWRPVPTLRLHADGLFSNARVRQAVVRPALQGKRLAQTPRLAFSTGFDWQLAKNWKLNSMLRHASSQFEDDENSLVLKSATTLDLGLSKRWSSGLELYFAVENLLDRRSETGLGADGIVTLGPPRLGRAGVRLHW